MHGWIGLSFALRLLRIACTSSLIWAGGLDALGDQPPTASQRRPASSTSRQGDTRPAKPVPIKGSIPLPKWRSKNRSTDDARPSKNSTEKAMRIVETPDEPSSPKKRTAYSASTSPQASTIIKSADAGDATPRADKDEKRTEPSPDRPHWSIRLVGEKRPLSDSESRAGEQPEPYEEEIEKFKVAPPAPTANRSPESRAKSEGATSPLDTTDVDDELSLTIEELEELAYEYNPTLREALANYERAYGEFEQVGLYPNPVLGYQGSEIGNEGKGGQQGAILSQEIVTADKLAWNRSVANKNLERLNWEIEAQTQRVRNDVRIRFYEALQAQLTVKAAEQLVTVAREGVRLAQALYEAQDGARIDVLQAEIELNQVEIVLQSANYARDASWRRLAYTVGLTDLPYATLAGSLEGEIPQYDFAELWQTIASDHPRLRAASARIQQASQQVQRERVQPIPNLDVQIGVQKDHATNYTIAQAQIGMALPIYNRNQGNIYSAFADMQRAEAERERLELWYRDQFAEIFRDFETARQRVERYQQEILPKALENLELTTAGYQQGEYAFLRVLVARETYFRARLEYLQAWTALRVADVRLNGFTLTGALDAAVE